MDSLGRQDEAGKNRQEVSGKSADLPPGNTGTVRPRPDIIEGFTVKVPTGCGSLYVTVNHDERGLVELFAAMGKGGGCSGALNEAIGRLVSLALRSGVPAKEIARQLRGIRCPCPRWKDGDQILSCADAIGRMLLR